MALPLIVFSFGLNGVGIKRGFLRGSDERYPLTTVKFIFFRAILLGKKAAGLHLSAMFGLADDSDWLIDNYPAMKARLAAQREKAWEDAEAAVARRLKDYRDTAERLEVRASKAEAENYALRKVIKICSE